jgi:hypothetical protein
MKTTVLIFILICSVLSSFAQSISLDPNSLQLPRVATNPACSVADKGKLIYNTTQNKILFCNGSAWVDPTSGATPNNWANSGNNSILLNGRAGVGTDSPTATVDINGNLRVRGNFPLKGSTLVSVDNNGTLNWQKPYAFRVEGLEGEANITISPNNGSTQLLFAYPDYNIGLMYSVNSGKFTAPVKGVYHIDVHVPTYKKTPEPTYGYSPSVYLIRKRTGEVLDKILQYSKFNLSTDDGSNLYGPAVHHNISGDFMLEAGDILWVSVQSDIGAQLIDGGKNQISFAGRLVLQVF